MTSIDWSTQGARLTAEAIKTTTRFLPARLYEIKLIPVDRQLYPVIIRHYTKSQLLKSVRYLRRKNAEGYHVYFWPITNHLVFVNDVCDDDIQLMINDNVRSVLVCETSEGLHHAWVQLANRPEQVTDDEARQARVILAERYSGDKDATSKNQPGRLPGFRNLKPMHEDSLGGHPLVKTKRSSFTSVATSILMEAKQRISASPQSSPLSPGGGVTIDTSNDTGDDLPIEVYDHGRHFVTMSANYEVGNICTAYDRALNEMTTAGYFSPIRNSGTGVDRSKQDIAVVHHLRSHCVHKEIIADVLLHGSDKAIERGTSYVEQTIRAVFK